MEETSFRIPVEVTKVDNKYHFVLINILMNYRWVKLH